MPATAQLLLPPPALSGCLFAAIERDTRGATLSGAERYNHFPASPLYALTFHLVGQTHLVNTNGQIASEPLPPVALSGPQDHPTTSWNPGPVHAITIAIYPEAWRKLSGAQTAPLTNQTTATLPDWLAGITANEMNWASFQSRLSPLWQRVQHANTAPIWQGPQRIADWGKWLALRAATSGPGQSVRAAERRLRRWTGRSRQSLDFHARVENLHRLVTTRPAPLAQLAHDAGYADQSHMGRAVKRATGFSPAEINRRIAQDESFWCYRLLGERF